MIKKHMSHVRLSYEKSLSLISYVTTTLTCLKLEVKNSSQLDKFIHHLFTKSLVDPQKLHCQNL